MDSGSSRGSGGDEKRPWKKYPPADVTWLYSLSKCVFSWLVGSLLILLSSSVKTFHMNSRKISVRSSMPCGEGRGGVNATSPNKQRPSSA